MLPATDAPAPATTPTPTATAAAPTAAPATAPALNDVAAFDPNAPPPPLSPSAPHVATSAQPDRLWGPPADPRREAELEDVAGAHPRHGPGDIARRAPSAAELKGEIADRVHHLDHKWRYTRNTNKLEELEKYTHESDKLDPDTRAKLQPKLAAAHSAEQKLDQLEQQAKTLGHSGTPEQRTELAHQLAAARTEVSTTVGAATKVIDDAGLQVDRLAHAEKDIDPKGWSEGHSLFGMLSRFFSLSYFISSTRTQLETKEELIHQQLKHTRETAVKDDLLHQRVLLEELQQDLKQAAPRHANLVSIKG